MLVSSDRLKHKEPKRSHPIQSPTEKQDDDNRMDKW